MSDFQVQVGGDFSELLRGFQQLEARAQQSGQAVGKGLGEGIQGFSSKSLAALNTELSRLQQRQTKVAVDSSAFEKTGRRIAEVESQLRRVEQRRITINADPKSVIALRARLADLQGQLERVAIGSQAFQKLQSRIRATGAELNNAGQQAGAFRNAVSGIGGGLAGQLAGIASFGAVVGFFKGSIGAAVQLETITKKLSNTLGPQGAGEALAFTKGLSNQLGLSFKTLAGSFGSFTAAATAANVPIEQQKALFGAVAKSAQALGLSNDEISGSLLALQQVAAKGTVQMEELRGQLGERLPIAFAATAKGLGLTQQELIKLVESGQLTADQFFPALTKGLNELTASAGGTETAAQNFQRLANAWDELMTSFGTDLLPTVVENVKALEGVLKGIGVVMQANKLGLGGGVIGNALGIIPEQGAEAVGALQALQQQYNLTGQQARALFTDAVKGAGGSYNAFGQLNLSAKQFEQVLAALPELAEQFRAKNKDTTAELNAQAVATARLLEQSKKRAEEEQKTLDAALKRNQLELDISGIDEQANAAKQLATLEGTELLALQQKLAINDTPEKLFQLAAFAESYKTASDALSKAQIENTNALYELAKKTWQVNVNVDSNGDSTVSGDAIPPVRWAGGPVDAGQTVRINDGPSGRSLGQESFLTAAGKLSLINRPANSLWTPSTSGVVIPAGVTGQLKSRGVFDSSQPMRAAMATGNSPASIGGNVKELAATVAHQAIAIGKLQQSVDRLVAKNWNVNVGLRDNDGSNNLNMLNRMV